MTTQIDETWYERDPGVPERVSAGGVVCRIEAGMIYAALVRERGLEGYVIPKGGVDENESSEEAALREIEEETGLHELTKLIDLATTERMDNKRENWSINHYAVFYTTQTEGEILDSENHWDLGWFALDELPPMAWPDEKQLLEKRRREIYEAVIAHKNPKPRKRYFM